MHSFSNSQQLQISKLLIIFAVSNILWHCIKMCIILFHTFIFSFLIILSSLFIIETETMYIRSNTVLESSLEIEIEIHWKFC